MSRNLHCNIAAGDEGIGPQYLHARSTDLGGSIESRAPVTNSRSLNNVDGAVCNELVDIYFDLIHDKQHSLFHRPTFIADQREGRAPMVLVYAMMALAAR